MLDGMGDASRYDFVDAPTGSGVTKLSWDVQNNSSQRTNPLSFSPLPRVTDTNVTPSAIRANWYALSSIPEPLYMEIVKAASVAERRKPQGHPGLSANALKAFLKFWNNISDIATVPAFSVSPKGFAILEWFKSPDESLVLMISRDGTIYYSLFDNGYPCEGYEPESNIADIVQMFRIRSSAPLSWSDTS